MYKKIFLNKIINIIAILLFCFGCRTNIQVNETSINPIIYEETIHINNCGGKADSEQIITHDFSTSTEGKVELGVNEIALGSISTKYNRFKDVQKTQRLVAPPATNMEFILRWYEQVYTGNVLINGITDTYEVHVPFAVEQLSSKDLGCSEIVQKTASDEQPTSFSNKNSPDAIISKTDFLGEWLYKQPRAPMPEPAKSNQVIFAHGDIDNSGVCHVKVFRAGQPIQGLGLGSFKLWLITGSDEYIKEVENQLQKGAAFHAGTDCPYLP